jgi:hypothetical protein
VARVEVEDRGAERCRDEQEEEGEEVGECDESCGLECVGVEVFLEPSTRTE